MGINISGRGYLGMSQLFRDCDNIDPRDNQNTGDAVPEAVRVNMGQPPPPGKLIQPCRDAGGIHGAPVILREQVPGILPAVTVRKLQLCLRGSVPF